MAIINAHGNPHRRLVYAWEGEIEALQAENARLRAALTQFVAACDTAPPVSLMTEIAMARKAAGEALGLETKARPNDDR
jgi:hypothetical protein